MVWAPFKGCDMMDIIHINNKEAYRYFCWGIFFMDIERIWCADLVNWLNRIEEES